MNELTLWLWTIDITSSFKDGLVPFLVFSVIGTVILGIGAWNPENSYGDTLLPEHLGKACKKGFKWAGSIFLVTAFFNIVIPSKDTMYMMLGSEVGEELIKSDAGEKSLSILENKLEEILREQETFVSNSIAETKRETDSVIKPKEE